MTAGAVKKIAPSIPAQYRQLLREERARQLSMTAQNVRRLSKVYGDAIDSVVMAVSTLPSYMLEKDIIGQAYLRQLLQHLDSTLANLATDYGKMLDVSMLEMAQSAAEREAKTARMLETPNDHRLAAELTHAVTLSDGTQASVQFGIVAQNAVERAANRVWSDGWKLSDRLYNLDAATRQTVQDTIVQGVAEQVSAKELAARLQTSLTKAGADNPRYKAMRIARTEINTAHREAHILSTMDESGNLKPFLSGVRWNLSLSHPRADICDLWANGSSDGLPSGVYLPEDVPSDHPHGLCYTSSELVDYPGIGGPGKKPAIEGVPSSQVAYYARQGDPVAARRLAQLEAQD
jgi:hypothetical protein